MLALRGRALLFATLLAVSLSAPVRPVFAQPSAPSDQDKAAARGAATQGAEAFNAKRYAEAINLFTRAESMFHAPPHLLMIARSHVALGHLVAARENYLKLTREELAKNAPAAFKKALADAQTELKDLEPRIASLNIIVTPKDSVGVVVTMDGSPVPAALIGLRHPSDPGKHTLVATAKGMQSKEVTITLADGGSQEVTLELVANAVTQPPAPTGPVAPVASDSTEGARPPSSKTMRYVSYGAVGAGAVAVGVGTLFAVMSSSKQSDANAAFDKCGAGCSGPPADNVRSLDSAANSRGNVAIASFAGGAALIGGGIVGILMTREKPAQSSNAPSVTPLVGLGSIGAFGTFLPPPVCCPRDQPSGSADSMSVASARVTELDLTWAQAERIAQRRNEPITTWHLLAAVVSQPGPASDLLSDFKLSPERLRDSAAHVPPGHESADRAQRAIRAAVDFAQRTRVASPTAIHLLTTMLGERSCHAYRVLSHAGVDVGRLRTAVMQVALGVVPPRRAGSEATAERHEAMARAEGVISADAPEPVRPARMQRGQTVRLIPDPIPPTTRSVASPPLPPQPHDAPPQSTREVSPEPASPRVAAVSSAVAVPLIPEISQAKRERSTSPRKPRANQRDLSRFTLDPSTFPVLSRFSQNLTLAMASEAPVLVGRTREVQQALDVLAKRAGNCPVLVGPPGVGKSSTLRAIALATATSLAGSLDDRIVVELDLNDLIAGTGVRGALLERVQAIRTELSGAKRRVVLAVEDVSRLFTEGLDDEAGTELRAAMTRGEIPLVGTASPEEHRRWIESDPVLSRCTSPVWIDEPSRGETFEILRTAAPALASHHRVQFPEESLSSAVTWTSRYMTGRAFPEKAVSVLDLAGARAHRRGLAEVPLEVLADVIAEQTEVPAERLLETDAKRMLSLEQTLATSVVGHTACLSRIAAFLRRSAAGIHGARPLGSFMLLGPTGVGKTETAKALARSLFGSTDAMTRVDMSEFSEAHAVARLIGAPPGYVGHEAGGQLTEAVRRRPYQVVLLDEIEKAHRDVLQTFLQVFDEGRLTDGRGRTVDFTQCVIVLTSNLGAGIVATRTTSRSIGFQSATSAPVERESNDVHPVIQAARDGLPPELYNRIDEALVYEPLTRDDVREIARRLLRSLGDGLRKTRGIDLEFSNDVVDLLLARGGFEPELGARPMKRAIAKWVESPLAERLLMASIRSGDRLTVHVVDGQIKIEPRRAAVAG